MIRNILVRAVFAAILLGTLSGCSSITNYSVSSYQGALPMEDHRYVDTYGSSAAPMPR